MNTQTTISISKARAKIFDIAEDVQKPGRIYTFTEKGSPKAVLMSADEFESLIETLEILEQFPNIKKDVAQVDKDIKTGAWKKYTNLGDIFKNEKRTNAIFSKARKTSSKRAK